MSEITVTIIEQPGALGETKARRLSAFLEQFYADNKEEVDRRVKEMRKKKETVSYASVNSV